MQPALVYLREADIQTAARLAGTSVAAYGQRVWRKSNQRLDKTSSRPGNRYE